MSDQKPKGIDNGLINYGDPEFASFPQAAPSVASLHFVGWQEPVGCGGVGIFRDDIVVVDDDGAVL